MAAPTDKYILDRLANLKTKYAKRDALIKEVQAYRYMEKDPVIPEAYQATAQVVKTPYIFDQLSRVTATLAHQPPVFSVPELGPPGFEKEKVEVLEVWSNGLIPQLERQVNKPFIRLFVDAVTAYGSGALKFIHDFDVWGAYPRPLKDQEDADYNKAAERWKRGAGLPFYARFVHPLTYYPIWSEMGLVEMFEATERERLSERDFLSPAERNSDRDAKLGEAFPYDSWPAASPTGSVKFVEHWTPEWVTYLANGKIVKQYEHKYGRVPYFVATGQGTCDPEPEYEGLSIAYPLRDLQGQMDQMLTMLQNAVYLYSWPTPYRQRGPAAVSPLNPSESRNFEPGKWIEGFPDEKVGFLEPPQASADRAQLIGMISNMMDRAGISSVMAGVSPGAQPVGYAINQLMLAAQANFDPITAKICLALGDCMSFAWFLTKSVIKERVYVLVSKDASKNKDRWVSLAPEDIADYRYCECALKPLIPSDHILEGDFRAKMRAMGHGYDDWVDDALGIGQPELARQKRMVDDFLKQPFVQQMIMLEAAKKAGFTDLVDVMMPGGGGGPPPEAAQAPGYPGGAQGPDTGQPVVPGLGMPPSAPAQPTRVRRQGEGGGRASGAPRGQPHRQEGV